MPTSYGMRDPLADLNARLRRLGLEPISLGGAPARPDIAALYQRPIRTPSPMEEQQALAQKAKVSGPMYNQLTPEAEEGVMEKIGGGLLSGVEWFGRTLDSITGARAIRGVLGGNFREALSLGPLGLWSDAVGLTDPQDIIGGRELMEKAGILEKNKPGLDWGDVGGFAAEVLLDPSTYFFGAGLVTKGAGAATKAGKALGKVGALDDILKVASTNDQLLSKLLKRAADAGDTVAKQTIDDITKGVATKGPRMGQRQLGRRLDVQSVLDVDDELTMMLKNRFGTELPDELAALKSSFRGLSGRSVREALTESVGGAGKLKKLMSEGGDWVVGSGKTTKSMPLTSHWSMGFPTLFTGEKGTKGIRQLVFSNLPDMMTRRQYFPSLQKGFGKNIDAFAGRLDVAGDIMRFGKHSPILKLAPLFNPALKWDAQTAIAQRKILNDVSKFDRKVREIQSAIYSKDSSWRKANLFVKDEYMKELGLSEEAADALIRKQQDAMKSFQEGWNFTVDEQGVRLSSLPEFDVGAASAIKQIAEINISKANRYRNNIAKRIEELQAETTKDVSKEIEKLLGFHSEADEMVNAYARVSAGLSEVVEPQEIGDAIAKIKGLNKKYDKVAGPSSVTAPSFEKVFGGVHHRVSPDLHDSFKDIPGLGDMGEGLDMKVIEKDLNDFAKWTKEALAQAESVGMNISDLKDEWALYSPRSVTEPQRRGLLGAIESAKEAKNIKGRMKVDEGAARTARENLNPITERSSRRKKYLRDIFGGTTTLNHFYTKYGGPQVVRTVGESHLASDETVDLIVELSKDNFWGRAFQNEEYLESLIDRKFAVVAEFDEAGEVMGEFAGMLKPDQLFEVPGAQLGDPPRQVHINIDSKEIRSLAESILDKSKDIGEGAHLFSDDPIRSMLGYYGDVMKAASAGEILINLASENAFFDLARAIEDLSGTTSGAQHTVGNILKETSMDTVIGKRNFINRFMLERPEEWANFKRVWVDRLDHLPEAQQDALRNQRLAHPDFVKWISGADGGEIKIGDRIAGVSSEFKHVRGKKVVEVATLDDYGNLVRREIQPNAPVEMPAGPRVQPGKAAETPEIPKFRVDAVEPMSPANIDNMEDKISLLRNLDIDLEPTPEYIRQIEEMFEKTGILSADDGMRKMRHDRFRDKSDWRTRLADNLEDRLTQAKEKIAKKQVDDIPPARADAPTPAKATEQIAPALTGDQASLIKPTGEAVSDSGGLGYQQDRQRAAAARARDVTPPVKPAVKVGPEGRAGDYGLVDGEWIHMDNLVHMDQVPNHIIKKFGTPGTEKNSEGVFDLLFSNLHIERELSDDLKRYLDSFTKRDITNEFRAAASWYTDVFKDLVTSIWPAFHFRNFISGQVNNMYSGAYDPNHYGFRKWTQPILDAMAAAEGKEIVGISNMGIFKNMDITDAQATQMILDAAQGHGLIGSGQHVSDLSDVLPKNLGAQNFLEKAGGPHPLIQGGPQSGATKTAASWLGGAWGRTLKAGKLGDEVVGEVPKLGKTIPGARPFTSFKRAGFHVGNEVEFLNRISPLIAHLKKGLSMEEAIMKVKLAQVDYKFLTPWEKQFMKRVIPFYTFTRRQVPFVLEHLTDPSSGMSQMAKTMFRTKHAMEDPNEPTPDWISHGVNLPLHKFPAWAGGGGTEPGMARYLTGLGGMIGGAEDVMSLVKPGHGLIDTARRMGSGLAARANPIAVKPLEVISDYSFFYQRPLSDTKSSTARLMGQVSDSEFVPKWPSPHLDTLLQGLPGFGRVVSTAKTLTDTVRKPIIDEEGNFSVGNLLARTMPTATGVKIHDTDLHRNKNRLLQRRLEEILSRNPNMVKFSQIYIPEERLGALSQEELEAYMLYKKLGAAASKASYARKKAAEYSN